MRAQPVGHRDRLLGISHADVHMHAEDELLAGHEAERMDEAPIAIVADDPLLLPTGKRVSPRSADVQVLGVRTLAGDPPQLDELGPHRRDVPAWRRGDLEHRLEELGLDFARRRILAEDRVDPADELEGR